MSSDFRKKKYCHIFDFFLDTNRDGYIDKMDFDLVIEKTRQLRGWSLDDPQLIKLREMWYQILDGLLQELDVNKDKRVSREEWSAIHDKYSKDLSNLPKWNYLYEDLIYDYFNPHNKPEGIMKEDYVETMAHFAVPEKDAAVAFENMSQGKGVITKHEFKQLWREYFVSDNPEALGNNIAVPII